MAFDSRNLISLTPATLPNMEDYWASLGQFIDQFARIEFVIFLVLARLSKMDGNSAKAVLSGFRMKEAASLIRRLFEVQKHSWQAKREIGQVLTQLGHIIDARNDIIHYGAQIRTNPKALVVTNRLTALTDSRIRERVVSPEMLEQMTADLIKINYHLLPYLLNPADARQQRKKHRFRKVRSAAWQYTPPAQHPVQRKRREKPPRRSRQPRSSRG